MFRITLLTLALAATNVYAQSTGVETSKNDCENADTGNEADCEAAILTGDAAVAAEAEGITGFVPLVAPALGAAAAAAGVAAAVGGGGTPATTSTVSTN